MTKGFYSTSEVNTCDNYTFWILLQIHPDEAVKRTELWVKSLERENGNQCTTHQEL